MATNDTITMRPRSRDALVIPILGQQTYMQFDAVISEEHGQKLTVTENPTELGTKINDHCYVDAAELSLTGSVSDIKMPNAVEGYDAAIGRSNSAYQQLVALEAQLSTNDLQPFDIITSVKTYSSMVLTEISMKRDNKSPLLGRFEMKFRQIITVETQVTTYKALGKTGRSAAKKQDNGKQQGPAPTPAQAAAVNQSAGKTIFTTLGNLKKKLLGN